MSRKNWTDERLLFRLLNNKTERTYWNNLRELRSRPNKSLFNKCVELANSSQPKERKAGIHILAQLGVTPRPFLKETIQIYFQVLKTESDPNVLMTLLYSIGHNNDDLSKHQIKELCSLSDTNNDWVKEGLVFSLLGIDNPMAIDSLVQFSSDKLSHIRNWSTFGIGTQIERNNKKIREALWKRVDDKHQETKLEAILGLALRKDLRVKDIIIRELIEGKYGTLLFESIEAFEDVDFLPYLKNNLSEANNDKEINSAWLKDLESCIKSLEKITA